MQTAFGAAELASRRMVLTGSISALRLHYWSKNVLIVMPLALSHQWQPQRLFAFAQAFFAFSCCASAFYVFNDLLDIEADRAHPSKSTRPFASGRLSTEYGLLLVGACFIPMIALAWKLSPAARIVLFLYAVTNLAYTVRLKQVVFLDVLILALLHTFRLVFGGAAEQIEISRWTLAFSVLVFLGLAFIKRWAELLSIAKLERTRLRRRGYLASHLSTVRACSQWSLGMSLLVLAFYINSVAASKLYRYPQVLWLVCGLLFVWIRRLTVMTNKGLMSDDPVLFACKDPWSHVIAFSISILGVLAVGL